MLYFQTLPRRYPINYPHAARMSYKRCIAVRAEPFRCVTGVKVGSWGKGFPFLKGSVYEVAGRQQLAADTFRPHTSNSTQLMLTE